MYPNRNQSFIKIEKNAESLESYRDFPLIFIMKDMVVEDEYYSEMYIGTLDCVEGHRIYLEDTYEINEEHSMHLGNEFKKWDLTKEDPTINEFPHIKLEFIDSIYVSKLKLTLEQVWNVWSDPRDFFKTEDKVYQKIQDTLRKNEKNFENNKPLYLDKKGNVVSLNQIFDIESVDRKPVTLIGVTRNQFDTSRFPEFERYIKTELKYPRHYYGLWRDEQKQKPEYEVVYAIQTNDYTVIQRHLNLHDDLNDGIPQEVALVIFPDGNSEIVKNSNV